MCYVRTISHREMRNNSAAVLRDIANGETVQVTNNGVVAAIITAPTGDELSRRIDLGLARPALAPLSTLTSVQPTRSATSSAEIIADSRGRW